MEWNGDQHVLCSRLRMKFRSRIRCTRAVDQVIERQASMIMTIKASVKLALKTIDY